MQNFNIHSHTNRCFHAIGEDEEYVIAAIKNNLKVLGFSDHVPFDIDYPKGDRMLYSSINEYMSSIRNLKNKYKSNISILLGFECEYFEIYDTYYKELLEEVDYLILGQHYPDNYGLDYSEASDDERVLEYAEKCCLAMKTGYFTYLAHPDYFMLARDHWSDTCTKAMEMICKTAKECNMPVEINLKGLSYGKREFKDFFTYFYPHKKTLEVIEKYGNDILFGLDCHNPEYYDNMQKLIDEFYFEYPNFKGNFIHDISQLKIKSNN